MIDSVVDPVEEHVVLGVLSVELSFFVKRIHTIDEDVRGNSWRDGHSQVKVVQGDSWKWNCQF